MKQIPLTRGLFAVVDDDDYDKFCNEKWYATTIGNLNYATRVVPYINNGKPKKLLMHRVIMGDIKGIMYDHIDGNGLNNQKSNLRICTLKQNGQNRGKNKIGLSKYKGVSWHKLNNRWISQIQLNKKCIHIGYFNTEEEAALAYNKKAIELFGEFARLNDIDCGRSLRKDVE